MDSFRQLSQSTWLDRVFSLLEKEEIHRDRPTPQPILVEDFVAAMKCQQQQPARLQHSMHFPKDRKQRFSGNVDDGIERGDAYKCSIGKVQGHLVSFPEGNVWVESSGTALTFAEKDPGRKWVRPHRAGIGRCDRDRSPCRILRPVL